MGKGKPNVPLCSLRHLTLRALLILLMLGYGVSAYASDTKVSIDASGITLANVLKSIEQQTKYKFIYSKETINVITEKDDFAHKVPDLSNLGEHVE